MERDLVLSIKTWAILLLLMPLVVTNGTLFPFIVGKALLARSVIEIIFGLWVILAFKYPEYRPKKSWIIIAFAVYIAINLLAGIAGVSLTRSLWSTYARMQGIVDLAHWFLLVLVLASILKTSREWRILFNINLGISVVMALLGAAQTFNITSIPFFEYLHSVPRVDITLGNATFVGAYTLVNLFIGGGLLLRSFVTSSDEHNRLTHVWRLFWSIAIGLNLWMLFLSATRGAFVGLLAGLVVIVVGYIILGNSRKLKIGMLAITGLLVLIPVLLILGRQVSFLGPISSSSVFVARISDSALAEGSIRNRIACFSTGVEGFANRPILGWGPENFVVAFGKYFDGDPAVTGICDHAHNKLVEELATKGLLGFLSYLSLWVFAGFALVKYIKHQKGSERIFALFIAASLTAYFVQNLFLFDTPATLLQMMLLLAFTVYLEIRLREESITTNLTDSDEPGDAAGISLPRFALNQHLQAGIVIGLVMVMVASSVYFINYRPYRAATLMADVIDPSLSWNERLDDFDMSIELFEPLANYPRLVLFTMLANNLPLLPEAEATRALEIVATEAQKAEDAEPLAWQLFASLSLFYQRASLVNVENREEYAELAKNYTVAAEELAPRTYTVAQTSRLHDAFEANILNPGLQATNTGVLLVPVFLIIGVDELRYVWPDLFITQAASP